MLKQKAKEDEIEYQYLLGKVSTVAKVVAQDVLNEYQYLLGKVSTH